MLLDGGKLSGNSTDVTVKCEAFSTDVSQIAYENKTIIDEICCNALCCTEQRLDGLVSAPTSLVGTLLL